MKPNPASLKTFAAQVAASIQRSSHELVTDSQFHELAQRLFTLQLELNPPYRAWCQSRGMASVSVLKLDDFPALPASAWKELEVSCIAPQERTAVFHSSGTTGQMPSRHFHHADSLALYKQAALAGFVRRFPEVAERPLFWSLTPDPITAPHSSLAYMLGCFHREFGDPASRFWGETSAAGWEVNLPALIPALREAHRMPGPIVLAGTAFNFVHLLDDPQLRAAPTPLPPGSRVMETGGYKGRSRELPREELHAFLASQFNIPPQAIVTEYGMSELSSQAYSEPSSSPADPLKLRFPPWARALVVSPDTGREVPVGTPGILRILDLANVWSAFALQTADLAIRRSDGFELLGRLPAAEARGCSLLSVP